MVQPETNPDTTTPSHNPLAPLAEEQSAVVSISYLQGTPGEAPVAEPVWAEPPHDFDVAEEHRLIRNAQAAPDSQEGRDAFGELYHRYDFNVKVHLLRKGCPPGNLEDLTQETFARAWRGLDTFRIINATKGIEPWLVTIATNLLKDHWKQASYRAEITVAEPPDSADTTRDGDPANIIGIIDLAGYIGKVTTKLTESQLAVLGAALDEYSLQETADALGKTTSAIKALRMRARQNARDVLPPDYLPGKS